MRFTRRQILTLLVSLMLVPLFALHAEACTCVLVPDPPCRALGQADAVFDARVLRMEKVEPDSDQYLRRRFTMEIKKAYKGSPGKAVYVYTGVGDSDCGYRFKVGVRYLVYANENDGRLTASTCTRTREIDDATEDKAYFAGLSTMPAGASIFGRVVRSALLNEKLVTQGFSGIKIEIDGPETRGVTTNSEGRFNVSGLTPGNYRANAVIPEGFTLSHLSSVELYPYPLYAGEIPDKGCIETYWVFEPKTQP